MSFNQTGKLHTIYETNRVSDRFTKREFVIEFSDNPKYPQTVIFQLTGDRCDQLDSLKVGDEVRVEFNLRGRIWNSPKGEVKVFNSLDAWKVELVRAGAGSGVGEPSVNHGAAPSYDEPPFASASPSDDPHPMRHLRGWP